MDSERVKFGSKLGIVLATAGSAVGLGNVWRFPYMAGNNGGGAFIIIYVCCVLLLGIPCMVSEFIIGRNGASNMVRAYSGLANGTLWRYIGAMGVLTGFLIISYYAVVTGWCLQYIFASAAGTFDGGASNASAYFSEFTQSSTRPIVCTIAVLLMTHFVITRGVQRGIEKASKMFMPTLFILLLVLVVSSCFLSGASAGFDFIFRPDFSKIDSGVVLGALGQAFYSLSIGMGCVCTYASYFSRRTNLLNTAVQISVVDSLIAILVGLVIFPAAFSVGVSPDSGPSLVFVTLPGVFQGAFASMPTVGYVISIAFYVLLLLAALTSLISLHEVCTAFFYEELHISRAKGATFVTAACCVMGLVCSLSFANVEWLTIGGTTLFSLLDFVTGQVLLPAGGFFTCLFLGWYIPRKISYDQFTNWGTVHRYVFRVYLFCVRYVCPVCILMVFLDQFGLVSKLLSLF